ncbi:hypothetical protein [Plantactinospora sp. GCM10030261]|uniref:hypothetical protein n=1 Tax=Plantactinospora sp. GCM10030261 TaxID=3273420 RepID=UPI00361D2431
MSYATAIVIGILAGVVLGLLIDNVALGIPIGVAGAFVYTVSTRGRRRSRPTDRN